jgi:DNA-binding GntR family transcriptional regulator
MVIEKKILHEEIASHLREMIMKGELKEGEKINENKFCDSWGISKTPLREALRVLKTEGLISLVPNRGSYVTRPTFKEIKEMFDVMAALEGVSAFIATESMSDKDFSKLEKLHRQLEQSYQIRNQKQYVHTNNLFHKFVQKLAGNKTLNQILSTLRKRILLYRYQSLNLPERFDQSIKEHREILEAFQKRDPEKAELLMRMHLKNQWDAIKKLREFKQNNEVSASHSP